MEESIYNLIPHPAPPPEKPPRYQSMHAGSVVSGADPYGGMGVKGRTRANFGLAGGGYKPDPNRFLKKHEKEPVLPDPKAPTMAKSKVKPPIPAKGDVPVMGLVSSKNFVTSNAVETILSQPKNVRTPEVIEMEKPAFGKVPKYLGTVKNQIEMEKSMMEEFASRMYGGGDPAMGQSVRKMTENERQDLLNGLKAKWEKLNEAYQKLSFVLDTPAKRKRKEKYEEELTTIEKDIEMLSRRTVLVAGE